MIMKSKEAQNLINPLKNHLTGELKNYNIDCINFIKYAQS